MGFAGITTYLQQKTVFTTFIQRDNLLYISYSWVVKLQSGLHIVKLVLWKTGITCIKHVFVPENWFYPLFSRKSENFL